MSCTSLLYHFTWQCHKKGADVYQFTGIWLICYAKHLKLLVAVVGDGNWILTRAWRGYLGHSFLPSKRKFSPYRRENMKKGKGNGIFRITFGQWCSMWLGQVLALAGERLQGRWPEWCIYCGWIRLTLWALVPTVRCAKCSQLWMEALCNCFALYEKGKIVQRGSAKFGLFTFQGC